MPQLFMELSHQTFYHTEYFTQEVLLRMTINMLSKKQGTECRGFLQFLKRQEEKGEGRPRILRHVIYEAV